MKMFFIIAITAMFASSYALGDGHQSIQSISCPNFYSPINFGPVHICG